MNTPHIRSALGSDLPAFRDIIDAVELFPSEQLNDMFRAKAQGSISTQFWLTCVDDGPVAFAYCAAEPMTRGTWNLLLIAVSPDRQGKGIGAQLMLQVEQRLRSRNARVLLVETSATDGFSATRSFYSGLGYTEEARIRDYYNAPDDKVVYWKAL